MTTQLARYKFSLIGHVQAIVIRPNVDAGQLLVHYPQPLIAGGKEMLTGTLESFRGHELSRETLKRIVDALARSPLGRVYEFRYEYNG